MNEIQKIYIALFGRPADPSGLAYFNGVTNGGTNLTAINDLAGQPEYQARFAGQSSVQIITSIYQSLFNRLPEQAGRDYFVAQLNSGALTVNNIAVAIAQAAQGPDATILNNKVAAAALFTAAIDTPAELSSYSGSGAIAVAQNFISAVTVDPASVSQANADAAVANLGSVTNPISLTTGFDSISGTAGNDVITGTVENAPTPFTLNSGDTINGLNGTDTLKILSNSGVQVTPLLTNVENIEINSFGGSTVNLANAPGVQSVITANSTNFATVNGAAAIISIGATNTQAGSSLTVNYNASTVTGATDVQKIALNSATSTTGSTGFVVNGVEKFDVTATGANNVGFFGAQLTDVSVAGAGSLAVTNSLNTLKSYDASASTGAQTATFGGGNVAVKGGSAGDLFTFGTTFTAADTVDGGGGFDEIRVSTGGNFSLAAAAAPFVALTSVERVHFTAPAAGVTLNGATFVNTGITNIQFDTVGADIINNAGTARTYEFGTPNTGSATFNMNGPSTVLNVDLLGATTASGTPANDDADVNGITVALSGTQPASAVATLNLTSTGVSTFAATVGENGLTDVNVNESGTINLKAGSSLVLDGGADLDVNLLVNKTIVDASAFTGKLEIEGSTLVGATGGDVFTLGSGVTEIEFNGVNDSGVLIGGILRVDTVTGFTGGAGGDVLNELATFNTGYTAITAALQAQISALAGPAATLLAAANIAADVADAGAVAGWTAFTFQGNTYAQYDADGGAGAAQNYASGPDVLIQLTGTDVATLTSANFA